MAMDESFPAAVLGHSREEIESLLGKAWFSTPTAPLSTRATLGYRICRPWHLETQNLVIVFDAEDTAIEIKTFGNSGEEQRIR